MPPPHNTAARILGDWGKKKYFADVRGVINGIHIEAHSPLKPHTPFACGCFFSVALQNNGQEWRFENMAGIDGKAQPSRYKENKKRKKKAMLASQFAANQKVKKNQPPTEKSRICTVRRPTPSLEKNKVLQTLQCATNQKREKKAIADYRPRTPHKENNPSGKKKQNLHRTTPQTPSLPSLILISFWTSSFTA